MQQFKNLKMDNIIYKSLEFKDNSFYIIDFVKILIDSNCILNYIFRQRFKCKLFVLTQKSVYNNFFDLKNAMTVSKNKIKNYINLYKEKIKILQNIVNVQNVMVI